MNENEAVAVVAGIIGLMFMIGMLVVTIFFLLSLQKNLNAVSEGNRAMNPPLVWLNLIPLFVLGWIVYTVIKISESLDNEFKQRGIQTEGKPAYNLGLTYAILVASSIIWSWIPFISLIVGIATLVIWIMYWVQISKYTKQLSS